MTRGGVVAQKKTRRRRGRPKAEDCSDEDEEYVVGEDGEEESSEESFVSSDSGGVEPSEAEFDSEEEEIRAVRPRPRSKPKPRKAVASGGRRRRGARAPARRKPRVGVGSRTRRARVSDDDEEDEDFDPDDVDEDEVSLISSRRSVLNPCPKRKRSKASSKQKNDAKKVEKNTRESPENRRVRVREEEDDAFVEKDASIDLENQNNRGNRKRKRFVVEGSDSSDFDYEVSSEEEEEEEEAAEEKPRGQPRRKNRSRILDSDSEFSDFMVSEDEEEVRGRGRPRKKKKKNERKKRSRLVDSESDFSDFVISDEELRDLGIGGESNGQQEQQRQQQQPQQPKRIVGEKKEEEKGKEKAEVDSGKQVCGICLSEEKKTTVQGVLECCAHYFCFACIMEWSKVESRCPVCKRRFASISKSGGPLNPGLGNRRAVIRVPKRDQVYQPSEEEMRGFLDPYENVVCLECQQGGDDYLMLLCDICDTPAHTYCVGLGREVPEGNWYCEGCRPIEDGFSYAHFVNDMDQGASSADPSSGHFSFSGIDNYRSTHSSTIPQPVTPQGQSPFLGIDLNVSPRYPWREEHESASQSPRAGASTLSGRRAIQQRIRILFNRARQSFPRDAVYEPVISSGVQRGGPLQQSDGLIHPNPSHNIPGSMQFQQNRSPFIQQSTMNEGSSFRQADGAKEQVQSMVRSHMKSLSRNIVLERAMYKDIARRSTHTILAACGIEHRREIVTSPVQLPNNCTHVSEDGPGNLMKNCCSACFSSFVQCVVEKLMKDS